MKKAVLFSLAAVIAVSAGAAQAGPKASRSFNQQWKQQQILAEEFRRAQAVGGYNDPLTALSNVLNGRATEKDIGSGVISNIYDTPGYGTLRLKGRWD